MGTIKFSIPKQLIRSIVSHISIDNFVETGTFKGETAIWAAQYFKNVFTIESDTEKVKDLQKQTDLPANITLINGDSKEELSAIINKLEGRAIFYLDTHSYDQNNKNISTCVVIDELKTLSAAKQPVIFINDARCFLGTNPDERRKNWPTFETIFNLLKQLFPESFVTIVDGVIVCAPKDVENIISAYSASVFEERNYLPDPEPAKRSFFERAINKAKRTIFKPKKPIEGDTVAYNIRNSKWFENQCKIFYQSHYWLKEQNFESIVDVGANVGQFGKKIRQYYPTADLYSFEPIPLVYKELIENFKGDNNFHPFNVGLGDKEGKLEFYLNEFSDSSSMLPIGDVHKENFPFTKNEKKIYVDVKTLDNCIDVTKIKKPYLVKLDVQGFEEQVINGGMEIIRNAEMIITEASFKELYKGQSLFDTLYEKIKAFGFQYIGNLDQMNSAFNGEPLQGDAIFRKVK